jgi:hypothetical protein
MARRKTGQRYVVNEAALRVFLASGHDYFTMLGELVREDRDGLELLDEEFLRQCWRARRAEMLADYEQRHPGRAPWAYWVFDRGLDGRPANEEEILTANGKEKNNE